MKTKYRKLIISLGDKNPFYFILPVFLLFHNETSQLNCTANQQDGCYMGSNNAGVVEINMFLGRHFFNRKFHFSFTFAFYVKYSNFTKLT